MADPITTVVVTQAVDILVLLFQKKDMPAEIQESALLLQMWLRRHVHGRTMEALIDLEKSPSEDNVADLRKQLAKLIEDEPKLRVELQEILPNSRDSETIQNVSSAIRSANVIVEAFSLHRDDKHK